MGAEIARNIIKSDTIVASCWIFVYICRKDARNHKPKIIILHFIHQFQTTGKVICVTHNFLKSNKANAVNIHKFSPFSELRLSCLTLEYETDMLYRNVGNYQSTRKLTVDSIYDHDNFATNHKT
jgi:hypothetical protein